MDYPASIEVRTPDRIANWRPLVQWLLGLPHLIIANALSAVGTAVAVVSWFAIVFTGSLPSGLAQLQIMIYRYTTRAETYAGFLYDDYPPFEWVMSASEPGGSPVEIDFVPELENRNRVTVGFRLLLAIPAILFTMLIAIVGLISWFLGFFAVLFVGRWPEGLRSWVVKTLRVATRTSAYVYLLTDQHPPFSTD